MTPSRRTSSRWHTRPATTQLSQQPEDEDHGGPPVLTPAKRPRKRAKATVKGTVGDEKPKLRGNRGKLVNFTEMPLDILFEIFGHMQPQEILRLARTTKPLRAILMNRRTAISIWKSAFANCPGIPDCPADMTEPQHANLLFSNYCHLCSKPNAKAFWMLRIRYCAHCADENSANYDDIIMPHVDCVIWEAIRMRGRFGIPDFVYGVPGYPPGSLVEFTRAHDALPSEEAREAFREQCRERLLANCTHGDACKAWVRMQRDERSQELEETRNRRYNDIVKKLLAIGYGSELGTMKSREFLNHDKVKQAKELTDREWQRIRPDIVDYIEQRKEELYQHQRALRMRAAVHILRTLVDKHNMSRPSDERVMAVADICLLPPFKSVIVDTPLDFPVTEASFRDAMQQLPRLTTEWFQRSIDHLSARLAAVDIEESPGPPSSDKPSFDFATSWFRCIPYACCLADPCQGTDIVTHHHKNVTLRSDEEAGSVYNDFRDVFSMLRHGPWRTELFEPMRGLADLVRTCGLDPGVATAAEMDTLDPWMLCSTCKKVREDEKFEFEVFHWRAAVAHVSHKHGMPDSPPVVWSVLNEEQTEHAREQVLRQRRDPAVKMYTCMRCRERMPCGEDEIDLTRHLHHIHGVVDAEIRLDDFSELHGPPTAPQDKILLPLSLFQFFD
ncbi:hypothetical protein PLICRDRAFT_177732 [Plicaturopsis crispa FD-325 SS-3]|nr:hypothetical protein PLICRDRAFT_177732 [Plicaturopsis crispa FD-325 SS-3]